MTPVDAAILGVIQGITEPLPISSSGHLVLAHNFLNIRQDALTFDVMLHLGTLVAFVLYFWRDWLRVIHSVGRLLRYRRATSDWDRLTIYLILATIPGAIFGYLLQDYADNTFRSSLLVAVTLVIGGILLILAENGAAKRRSMKHMNSWDAGIIGLAQALALIPGISRSGITMIAALFRGLDRESAARFSFLLSVPIIAGAVVVSIPHVQADLKQGGIDMNNLIIGFSTSFVVGMISIRFLLRYVRKHSFHIFAYYRFALAAAVLIGMLTLHPVA
jgi:undecaprenyl-diphosphatase